MRAYGKTEDRLTEEIKRNKMYENTYFGLFKRINIFR